MNNENPQQIETSPTKTMMDGNGLIQDGMTTNKKDPKEEKSAQNLNLNGSAENKKEENKNNEEPKEGLREQPI